MGNRNCPDGQCVLLFWLFDDCFELRWFEVFDSGVFSFEVVVADVLRDLEFCGVMAVVFGHFEFSFDGSKAAFHEGVVVAVGSPAHALADVGSSQDRSVTIAGVLAASVTVMDQVVGGFSFANDSAKHLEDQFFGHVGAEIPSHDSPRESIHENGKIRKYSSANSNVGDVADPQLIDVVGVRCVEQQVRAIAQSMFAVGGSGLKRFGLNGLEPLCFK